MQKIIGREPISWLDFYPADWTRQPLDMRRVRQDVHAQGRHCQETDIYYVQQNCSDFCPSIHVLFSSCLPFLFLFPTFSFSVSLSLSCIRQPVDKIIVQSLYLPLFLSLSLSPSASLHQSFFLVMSMFYSMLKKILFTLPDSIYVDVDT